MKFIQNFGSKLMFHLLKLVQTQSYCLLFGKLSFGSDTRAWHKQHNYLWSKPPVNLLGLNCHRFISPPFLVRICYTTQYCQAHDHMMAFTNKDQQLRGPMTEIPFGFTKPQNTNERRCTRKQDTMLNQQVTKRVA